MARELASSIPLDHPAGWSRLQIVLHWLVVGLIALQYIDSGSMEALFDATFEGDAVSAVDIFLGWSHIIGGSAILAAMVVRLINRFAKGRPPLDASEPDWAKLLARIIHVLIYGTLLAMPTLGLLAWITGGEAFADLHTLLWTPLLVLIALHVTGALAQHFWFRSGALRRMTTLRKTG